MHHDAVRHTIGVHVRNCHVRPELIEAAGGQRERLLKRTVAVAYQYAHGTFAGAESPTDVGATVRRYEIRLAIRIDIVHSDGVEK